MAPAEVAQQVRAAGLDFFAVADHNCLAALPLLESAQAVDRPRLIYGVELSAQPEEGQELHLLGYGFQPACPALRETCAEIISRKKEQLREIVTRLRCEGIRMDADALKDDEEPYLGRPALADMLVSHGVVHSLNEAFVRYLGDRAATFVPMRPFSPQRCIEAIHEAAGVVVLAHPSIQMVDRWIEALTRMGLDGVEVYRPNTGGNEQLYVEKAAEHFGLFVTGGSDWHGRPSEPPVGSFAVSAEQVRDFLRRIECAG